LYIKLPIHKQALYLFNEQVYILSEILYAETLTESELHEFTLEIVGWIHHWMGYRPGRVYLLKPRAIPLTLSGKIQYVRTLEQYLNGECMNSDNINYPDYEKNFCECFLKDDKP
jgi:hypothetical protein